ncbi:MAG: hypothetical protein KC910_25410 [Candidatus Eremiobacteraeota bacterium]|nr:hypothetical protein [Candidatus Eremiobacteraeota bacterium]
MKKWAGRLLLMVGAVVFGLLLLEFVVVPMVCPAVRFELPDYRRHHPLIGWTLEPGAHFTETVDGQTFEVAYNSRGWHDLEHNLAKPAGVYRIVVLGDSFMEAYTVPLEQTFARLLEQQLDGKRRVEVINLGVLGYSNLQECLAFEEFGRRYQPDLVVLGFYSANDLEENCLELERGVRPHLSKTNQLIPPDHKLRLRPEPSRFNLGRLSLIMTQGRRLRESKTHWFYASCCEEPPVYTQAWDETGRIFARLATQVRASGAKLAVFTVPDIWQVEPAVAQKELGLFDDPSIFCLEEAPPNRRLAGILKELGVECIDLLPDFRHAFRDQGIKLYPSVDTHWNAAGHQLAATRVAEELRSRGLFPGRSGQSQEITPGP